VEVLHFVMTENSLLPGTLSKLEVHVSALAAD